MKHSFLPLIAAVSAMQVVGVSPAVADGAILTPPDADGLGKFETPEVAPTPVAPTLQQFQTNTPPPVMPSCGAGEEQPPYQRPYSYYQGQSSYYGQPAYSSPYSQPAPGYGYYANAQNRYSPLYNYAQRAVPWPGYNPRPYSLRPQYAYAPAGLTIQVTLATAISTQVARDGDYVQANITQNVPLKGLSYIPAGSALTGEVSNAESGRFFNRSGLLSLQFNQLRLPDGRTIPVQAHSIGKISRYSENNGVMRGEGWGTKIGAFALRAAIGAGSGAVLGTAIGAIAGRGHGIGTGAWAGTAIGGGLGAVEDLTLRRGRNVLIRSGTPMKIQLDEPIEIPVENGIA